MGDQITALRCRCAEPRGREGSKVWGRGGRLVAARLELVAAAVVAGQVWSVSSWCPQGPGEMNEG